MTPEERADLAREEARIAERFAALEADRDRLRAELAETTHVLEVTGEKVEAIRGQRDRAEAERDAYRAAQERLIAEVTDERRRRADHVRQVEAERDRLAEQRDAAVQLVSDAYTDAGANVQEGGSWPEWGPSVDGDDVLKALGALGGTEPGR